MKTAVYLGLLITTPCALVYPKNLMPHVAPEKVNWFEDWWWGSEEQSAEWVRPTTYDKILQMLEDLESGALERRHSPEQLGCVNDYLVTLAQVRPFL